MFEIVAREEARHNGLPRYFDGVPCKKGHSSERYTSTGGCCECTREYHRSYVTGRAAKDPDFLRKRHAQSIEWRRKHPEKARQYEDNIIAKDRQKRAAQKYEAGKKWRTAHPEEAREKSREWAREHKEQVADTHRKWQAENRDHMREYQRNRRAKDPQKARDAVKAWEQRNPERAKVVKRASKQNRRARELAVGGRVTGDDIAFLFDKQKGCCAGCGVKAAKLQVDHILAIARGGSNERCNMQLLCGTCNRSKSDRDAIEWAQSLGRLL